MLCSLYPDDLVIVTKVGPGRGPSGTWLPWATADQLPGQVEENLRQLGRDQLDVVNLRVQGPGSIAEHCEVLAELREDGLIRHLGVSNVGPGQLAQAQGNSPRGVRTEALQPRSRTPESDAVLETCGEQGIAFVPFFSIAAGGGAGGPSATESIDVVTIANAHGVTPAQVRLAWTLQLGPHVLAIPGTGDIGHLEENVAAGSLRLTRDEMEVLSR